MNSKAHWEWLYKSKGTETVSWFRPHLEHSIALIERLTGKLSSPIIDVGGGESTLVDDLLALRYQNITVLDISQTALELTKKRLGEDSEKILWLHHDTTQAQLPFYSYDLWHDRAVFYFLTTRRQREAYVRACICSVKSGGHVVVSTFGPEGPTRCSGLDVMQYDPETLSNEFGPSSASLKIS